MNDSNLQRLMSLSVLPAVTRMLLEGGSDRDTCAAAGTLLCTVVTLEAPRKEVSQLLASDPGGVTSLMDLILNASPTQQVGQYLYSFRCFSFFVFFQVVIPITQKADCIHRLFLFGDGAFV